MDCSLPGWLVEPLHASIGRTCLHPEVRYEGTSVQAGANRAADTKDDNVIFHSPPSCAQVLSQDFVLLSFLCTVFRVVPVSCGARFNNVDNRGASAVLAAMSAVCVPVEALGAARREVACLLRVQNLQQKGDGRAAKGPLLADPPAAGTAVQFVQRPATHSGL